MRLSLRTLLIGAALVVWAFWLWPRASSTWAIRNAPPGSGPIVCFGDSITRGHGATAGESYPEVLARLLGREVVNRGRDGDTSEEALGRLQEDVLALAPSVVIVGLGGNDMLRRSPIESTERSLREIFERTLALRAMVVFVAIDPPFVGDERMVGVRKICRELGVLYVDSAMQGFWGNPELMSDHIHPNAAGYRLMAERVREALKGRL